MHIFLTGDRQIGKSTLIEKLLQELKAQNPDLKIGGFFTKAGDFDVLMHYASTPESSFVIGKRKIGGFTDVFNTKGVSLLCDTRIQNPDLILMDELGWMESNAQTFASEVLKTLDGRTQVIGVLRKDCSAALIEEIKRRADVEVVEVTKQNRNKLVHTILEKTKRERL